MNKRNKWVAFACVLLSLLILPGCHKSPPAGPRATVAGTTFKLEIRLTEEGRRQGLSGRMGLPADHGMLFIFPDSQVRSFWMKDCYFPIDVAFLDENGRILNLHTMAVELQPARPRTTYPSNGPARYALEVGGGTWAKIGAKPGDAIAFFDLPQEAPEPEEAR